MGGKKGFLSLPFPYHHMEPHLDPVMKCSSAQPCRNSISGSNLNTRCFPISVIMSAFRLVFSSLYNFNSSRVKFSLCSFPFNILIIFFMWLTEIFGLHQSHSREIPNHVLNCTVQIIQLKSYMISVYVPRILAVPKHFRS